MIDIPENQLTDAIISSAIEVHKTLGPGLKEEVYEAALAVELGLRGIACRRQVPVVVTYKGVDIGDAEHPKRIDMLVDDAVVIECKALATAKDPLFRAQCLTYLKMTGKRVGLVLNFGRPTMKEGIERVINETKDEYRKRLEREHPASFRNVLREEDGLSEDEIAIRMAHQAGPSSGRSTTPNPNSVTSCL